MNTKFMGAYFEAIACDYLLNNNLKLIQRNYISKYGEIDIIMQDMASLVFVEVRARKNILYGSPIETINYKKQAKIIKTAQCFLLNHNIYEKSPYRFDAITLIAKNKKHEKYDLTWYKNIITADN